MLRMGDLSATPVGQALRAAVRETVARVAPEEVPLVEATLDAWWPRRRWPLRGGHGGGPGVPGGSVGVGIEVSTLTDLLLQVGVQALAQAGGLGAVAGSVWLWRRRRGRRPQARLESGTQALAHPLSAPEAARLREAVLHHGDTFGVRRPVAELFAQALLGALLPTDPASPPSDPPTDPPTDRQPDQ
jgi:hypothetical protein